MKTIPKSKILIITSEGCEACAITETLVKRAIVIYGKEVELETKDITECNKHWLSQNNISDTPTVLFIKGDIILHSFVGSRPVPVMFSWMNKYFE